MSELKKATLLMLAVSEAFKANPEADELHVTIDGNCFLSKDKSHADHHARSIGQKFQTISRSDFEEMKKANQSFLDMENELKELADAELAKQTAELEDKELADAELAKVEKSNSKKKK